MKPLMKVAWEGELRAPAQAWLEGNTAGPVDSFLVFTPLLGSLSSCSRKVSRLDSIWKREGAGEGLGRATLLPDFSQKSVTGPCHLLDLTGGKRIGLEQLTLLGRKPQVNGP